MFASYDGSTPPAAGTPSSTSAIAGYASQYNVPLTGGSNAAASPTDPYVFLAATHINKNTNATVAELGNTISGRKVSDLQNLFVKQSQDKQRHWALLLALAGYAGADASTPKNAVEFAKTAPLQFVLKYHEDLLQDAAAQFQMGRQITPEQLIREQLKYRFGNQWDGKLGSLTPEKAATFGDGGAGSTTHTSTSRSVDLMSPEDAKGMVRGTLQQALGRDPTQAEYEDFLATIHAAERSNPTTSRTTYTTDAQGNTTNQSTVSQGGLNQSGYDQLMYDKTRKMPSWTEWQAVGTYAPALFQALDAPISGV